MFIYPSILDTTLTRLDGLVADDGGRVLRLATLPGRPRPMGGAREKFATTAFAGIAAGPDGNVYLSDPANHRVLFLDVCFDVARQFGCFSMVSDEAGELAAPRGLWLAGGKLYVADAGNGRVVVTDVASGQVRAAWGEGGDVFGPAPTFVQPWAVAGDAPGNLYVADPGTRDSAGSWSGGRVTRLRADGGLDVGFRDAIAPAAPGAAIGLTVMPAEAAPGGVARLLVIDAQPPRVLAYGLEGTPDVGQTAAWEAALKNRGTPCAVLATRDAVYVGTDAHIHCFGPAVEFLGSVPVAQPVVAMCEDARGKLLVLFATGLPARYEPRGGFARRGTFIVGPLEAESLPAWHALRAELTLPSPGAHVKLYLLTRDAAGPAPKPPWDPSNTEDWVEGGIDAGEVPLPGEALRYLWIAGELSGDGAVTPLLRALGVEADPDDWTRRLPAIYRRRPVRDPFDPSPRPPHDPSQFLRRFIFGLRAEFAELDETIADLPLLMDPATAPEESSPDGWLDWLAGWLDFDPHALHSKGAGGEAARREALAGAFRSYATRGTAESLRALVQLFAGAAVRIEEPSAWLHVWSLGETSLLGFETMLPAAAPQGAVLATTAVLGQSHLTAEDDFGASLFDDTAHRFRVEVYAADVPDAAAVARVRDVLDREKPAHTDYHLCVVGPHMRVGFQSRIGIDSIIGGPPPALVLGGEGAIGGGVMLGGAGDGGLAGGGLIVGQALGG